MNEKIYKDKVSEKRVILPGNPLGLPDDFLKVIVFIDNAYLLRLKNHLFKEKFKYNLKNFVNSLAEKNKLIVEKIFLYDAPPFQDKNPSLKERKKKEDYDRFVLLFRNEGIIVREGRVQRLRVGDNLIYKQKGVDVLLGIDMIGISKEFPFVKNVVLLSGDSDFVPVIYKLNAQKINVILWTYFERKRDSPFSRSNDLIKSVNKYILLKKENFEEVKI